MGIGESDEPGVYDVVGVGFGPSGLSLAAALADARTEPGRESITSVFFERNEVFGWHRNMLLPFAKLQVSFLKDLVTFRNPTSPFSFVAYLHEMGRLARFVNNGDFFPTRREFHDYLEWVESRLAAQVDYGTEVRGIEVARAGDGTAVLAVDVAPAGGGSGRPRRVHAHNVVISTGLVPRMPAGIRRGENVWHSSEFLGRFEAADHSRFRRVVVAGAGQSAAEITRFLYDNLPNAEVVAVVPSYGYSVADNTPFANEVFDPEAVNDHYFGSDKARDAFWNYHRNTNYAVVDDEVIRDLYQRRYEDEVRGVQRLEFLRLARVTALEPTWDRARVAIESLCAGQPEHLDVDLLVCGTGYDAMQPSALLGSLADHFVRNEAGCYRVERDHRLTTDLCLSGGVYLQGGTEHTHGLSASLLSNIAVRSGEIVESILGRRESNELYAVAADAVPTT
jgi:L-ornithine N5-monooxygenase